MVEIHYDDDATLETLTDRTVAVLGFGSQGHAHARNLSESGVDVIVGLYPGSSSAGRARDAGLEVAPVADAVKRADIVMMLMPDTVQPEIYVNEVEPGLVEGNALLFAHGFNIHYGQITPPAGVDVCMVAPKGPGHALAPGGRLALNTNGGGLSYTHPGMLSMFLIIEAVQQLRGTAGKRQVPDARLSLVHGMGMTLAAHATAVLSSNPRA